jgi:hypothetical protein
LTQPRPLTPAAFRRWLKTLPPNETVGKRQRHFTCPIARYLAETCGERYRVDEEEYKPAYHGRLRRLPLWVREFVWAIDEPGSHDTHGPVLAYECLAVLREVQAEIAYWR